MKHKIIVCAFVMILSVIFFPMGATATISLIDGIGFEYDVYTNTTLSSDEIGTTMVPGTWSTSSSSWTTTTPTTMTYTSYSAGFYPNTSSPTTTLTWWGSTTPTTTSSLYSPSGTDSGSGAISDATLTDGTSSISISGVTTTFGGTTTTTLGDAFDGYNGVNINGVPYHGNGAPSTEDSGREIVLNPQTIGNLTVQRKVYVPTNDAFVRFLTIITNNSGATESVNMLVCNDLGSDTYTRTRATSSGDTSVTTADNWAVTSDESFTSDPRLGHIFQGEGAQVRTSLIKFHIGQDWPYWRYSFDVEAGQTVIIMNFATCQPSIARAVSKAGEIASLSANAIQGMSNDELGQVVNFNTTGKYVDPNPGSSNDCFIDTVFDSEK